MNNTILQIPMDKTVRERATARAKEYGFSSLQEFIRVYTVALIKGNVTLSISDADKNVVKKPQK